MLVRRAGPGRQRTADPQDRVVPHRLVEHRAPARPQDPPQLYEGGPELEVVQNRGADDQVEGVVGELRGVGVGDEEAAAIGDAVLLGPLARLLDLALRYVEAGHALGAAVDEVLREVAGA